MTDHINTPILSIYGQQIKGPWYTRDAAIRTLFTDSLCIHASAYSSDTTRYTLSTGKDQTTADEAPIYLTFTSLEGAVSRFSVESLTDSSLVLMSLENGNIWTLTRGSK
ncbi:hypothetical protein [Taibaiella chishuiensis]|uniref:hypothetical protein n=1 Tax=Taibaiella chishuiensis TaxID=1434707 RepID=UPI0011B1D84A|nr:hypothetical protein [Taibaiella chishuiensis]